MFHGLSQAPLTQPPSVDPGSYAAEAQTRHTLPVSNWLLPYPSPVALDHRPASQWTLILDGEVTQPITLRYSDLLVLPQSHQLRRIVSRQGWMHKAEWQGVLLKYLVNKVILKPGVRFLRQETAQGQHQTLPLDTLMKQDALLLLREGLHAISPWQGGPVRMLVYDQFAELGLSQLTRLSFLSHWPADEPRLEREGQIQPGKYYAYDLKAIKTLDRPGEARAL